MVSRPDHDVVRVRPKVRPCFFGRTAATPLGRYRAIEVALDHELSIEGDEGKSRLHARNFLVQGANPSWRYPERAVSRRSCQGLPAVCHRGIWKADKTGTTPCWARLWSGSIKALIDPENQEFEHW